MSTFRFTRFGTQAVAPLFLVGGCAASSTSSKRKRTFAKCEENRRGEVYNWSGTYKTPKNSETIVVSDELDILAAFKKGYTLKPIGSGLSPNGLPLANYLHTSFDRAKIQWDSELADGAVEPPNTRMMSLEKLNKIEVLHSMGLVKCDAGCTVRDVLDALAEHDMTLSNFSSITDQTIAGWTAVGAHGTGIYDSTVDDMIEEIEVITPAHGKII